MAQIITYERQTYSFGDYFTDEEIAEALKTIPSAAPEPETEQPPEAVQPPEVPQLPPPEPAEGFIDRTMELVGQGVSQFAGSTARGLGTGLDYFDIGENTQKDLDAFAAT